MLNDKGSAMMVARKRAKITQFDLAKKCNINQQTIIDIEKDRVNITEDQFAEIMQEIENWSENG